MSASVKVSPRDEKQKEYEKVIQRHTNKVMKGLDPNVQLKHNSLGSKLSAKNSKMVYRDDERLLFRKNKYDRKVFWVSSPDVSYEA